jgi:hypothetical protein
MRNGKYTAQLGTFYLNVVSIREENEYGVISHEIPFSKRNVVQNTGRKTRSFRVSCVFYENPAAEIGWVPGFGNVPNYQNYTTFKKEIDDTGDNRTVFVHPDFGALNGNVKNISAIRNDQIKRVNVEFTFWEELSLVNIIKEKSIRQKVNNQFRFATSTIIDTLGSAIDIAQNDPFDVIDNIEARLETFIDELNKVKSTIVEAADSIINTIDYGTSLAGRVIKAVNEALERVVQSFIAIRNFPASFINDIIASFRETVAIFDTDSIEAQYVTIMSATRISVEAAEAYYQDDTNREKFKNLETQNTFDYNGKYIGGEEIPELMTLFELENTLGNVRQFIDDAVQIDRLSTANMREQAVELQNFVDEIKLEREKIIQVEQPVETSIFTITNEYNGNYQIAERDLKLNPEIQNPNFVSGTINILVEQ